MGGKLGSSEMLTLGDLLSLGQLHMFESPASFHKLHRELRIQDVQLASMSQSSLGSKEQKSIHAGAEQGFDVLTPSSRGSRAQWSLLGRRTLPRTQAPTF